MSDPIRYSIVADYQAPWAKMHEFNAGGWVKWEDYARLKAELDRLEDENARLTMMKDACKRMIKRRDKWILEKRAEVERLREATEWKPIYTAPSFPTKILFGGYFKSGWGDGFWWQHGYKAGALLDMNATHWMPEPQPPAKDGKTSV